MTRSPDARLIFADSEQSADMLYATGLFVPDPFLWAQVGDDSYIIASPLEVGRLSKAAPDSCTVLGQDQAKRLFRKRSKKPVHQIAGLAKYLGIMRWQVPQDFPLGLATQLKRLKVQCVPCEDTFFPERAIKSAAEIEKITEGVRLAEAGLAAGLDILRKAGVRSGELRWSGKTLTSEILRGEIDAEIARLGGVASHTIVASGVQGADPHNAGAGVIRAKEPIILDIFPRVTATGYFGDLTRTVVKGKAPKHVKAAFVAVKDARDQAISAVKNGVNGKDVHQVSRDVLNTHGFETDLEADPPHGFIHGTGHGLGLEIHEAPRVSTKDDELKTGHVHTVEPGVYYPEWGGVRLEDVVCVTAKGCRNLTQIETVLELS